MRVKTTANNFVKRRDQNFDPAFEINTYPQIYQRFFIFILLCKSNNFT